MLLNPVVKLDLTHSMINDKGNTFISINQFSYL